MSESTQDHIEQNGGVTTLAVLAKDPKTLEFIDRVVPQLNAEIDFPWANEQQEADVIRMAVTKMANILPLGLLDFMTSAADGLDDAEIKRWEDLFVNFLNERVDVPWMPEGMEAAVLRPLVSALLAFARETFNIE